MPLLGWWLACRERRRATELVRHFRERHANAMVEQIASRDTEWSAYLNLRREVDSLKTRLRAAERRLMRHGLDTPDDID